MGRILKIIYKKTIQKEIEFWQKKYNASPNQTSYLIQLAGYYTSLFETTFEVNHLYKAEELLLKVNSYFNYSEVEPIRALAKNYITQHRFQEALILANKALKIGEGFKETQKLLFDVNMELGNYDDAKKNLSKFYNTEDFDYLIRMAKWNDHVGDLPTAITLMEKATSKAELNENKNLKIWSYSNLGDMYGHAGRISDSYTFYLKTLKEDENNYYALKSDSIRTLLFNESIAENIQELEAKYDFERRKQEAELLILQANRLQLKALRAQMNPHFIFNVLNSIHSYMLNEEIEKAVHSVLDDVGLMQTINQMPSELSGGQKKRIGIARTLILQPEIMLYDEPTAGLDPITCEEINTLINQVQERYKTSSIIITHDLTCTKAVGNRIAMLLDGKFERTGTFNEVFDTKDERVTPFYDYNFIQ